MTVFRQTWHFAGSQGSTWQEVYDVQAAEVSQAIPLKIAGVAPNRMACAHKTVTLTKITTRNLDDRTAPPDERPFNMTGTAANSAGKPANTGEAAVILLSCINEGGD